MHRLVPILVTLCVTSGLLYVAGCDRDAPDDKERPRAEAEETEEEEPAPGDQDQEHDHDEHDEFELAAEMYELARRHSAIWFAGKAGNEEMVDYQIHEIEELVERVEEASPTENGVDVADRLESDVLENLEELEEVAGGSDAQAFESGYEEITQNCTQCHADTGHQFIHVETPEYNPYPNIRMTPPE